MSFSAEFTRKYEVLRVLGEGGMGRVYLARERELSRLVAIKFLHMAAGPLADSPERFLEEAKICARLKHPNLAKVLFADTSDGLPYIVFEFVEGYELAAELKARGTLPVERALKIVRAILSALSEAHDLAIVHRDVKPANVLLRADSGEPVLMDFGVARAQASDRAISTQAGVILGTPAYMAPEVITGEPPTPAADVYAMGCLLFECLTGAPPFVAATDVLVLSSHVHVEPPSLRSKLPAATPALIELVDRALKKPPGERWADAGTMLFELERACPEVVSGAKLTMPMLPDPPAPAAGATRPMPVRAPSRPSTGARTRAGQSHGHRRRLLARMLAAVAGSLALLTAALAWYFSDSVRDVQVRVDDSGSLEATWTSRRSVPGQLALLPASRASSMVTSAEAEASTAHSVRLSALPAGLHHVAIVGKDGQPLWSAGVQVPARGTVRTARPRARGGAWEVTAPASGATEGHLIVPGAAPVRSSGLREGRLWFEHAFGADGPPPGVRVRIAVRPDVTVDLSVDRARDVADRLVERLTALPVEVITADISRLKVFSNTADWRNRGRMIPAAEAKLDEIVRERLVREGVWPLLTEFEPMADRFFATADDAARVALYEKLLKIEEIETAVLSQREAVRRPVRRLYRGLVEVEHLSRFGDPPPVPEGAVLVQDGARLWTPADYQSWDALSIWMMENRDAGVAANLPDFSAQTLSRQATPSLACTSDQLAKLRASPRVELRLEVAYLGPAYYFRVAFRSERPGGLVVHLGHPGDPDWFAAMDGRRPESHARSKAKILWGEIVARFPSRLLPPGRLRIDVTHEHLPGVSIYAISQPIHRAAFVHEISVRPVP
jgi:predicted nucleic acid-binding protein